MNTVCDYYRFLMYRELKELRQALEGIRAQIETTNDPERHGELKAKKYVLIYKIGAAESRLAG